MSISKPEFDPAKKRKLIDQSVREVKFEDKKSEAAIINLFSVQDFNFTKGEWEIVSY